MPALNRPYYSMKVIHRFHDVPSNTSWQRLLNAYNDWTDEWKINGKSGLRAYVRSYGGKMRLIYDNNKWIIGGTITFQSESDYTWFLLKH